MGGEGEEKGKGSTVNTFSLGVGIDILDLEPCRTGKKAPSRICEEGKREKKIKRRLPI